MLRESFFFWPSGIVSSLAYARWDDEQGKISDFFIASEPMVFSSLKDSIFAGEKALLLAEYYPQVKLNPLFSAEVKLFGGFDVFDSTALVINILLKKLSKKIESQLNLKLPKDLTMCILDFDNMFESSDGKLSNITRAYLARNLSVVPGRTLLDSIKKNENGVHWILADDSMSQESIGNDYEIVDVFELFDSFIDESVPSLDGYSSFFGGLIKLLRFSNYYDHDDWYQSSHTVLNEGGLEQWVLDKRHWQNFIKEATLKCANKAEARPIKVVGQFSEFCRRVLCEQSLDEVTTFDREQLIRYSLINGCIDKCKSIMSSNQKKYDISIGESLTQTISFSQKNKELRLDYQVRFFGRKKENIEITIADQTGVFTKWIFQVGHNGIADVCEVGIVFARHSDGFIDCKLVLNSELYIVSEDTKPMFGEHTRPLEKILEISTLSTTEVN